MTYELALKLEEAGFHQGGWGFYKATPDDITTLTIGSAFTPETEGVIMPETKGEWIYFPTLSELIEACGLGFESLTYTSGINSMRTINTLIWKATAYGNGELYVQSGSTPEEAVANLWLALNPIHGRTN